MNAKLDGKVEVQICRICGKPVTTGSDCGAYCAKVERQGLKANRMFIAEVPEGFITLGDLGRIVKANREKFPGLTVSKVVNCIGRDGSVKSPTHPICQPYYLISSGARYVSGWLKTPAGLKAMATSDFKKAPEAPKVVTVAKG